MWKPKTPEDKSLNEAIKAIASANLPAARSKLRLPNVIGVGSGRCGTSYLFGLLASHRDFYVSPLKEVNYFAIKQAPFCRTGWSIEDYRLCFASQQKEKFVAEVSPVYLANPVSIQQISLTLNPVHLIATIREPISRLVSHFKYHRTFHGYNDINRYVEDALDHFTPGYFDLKWNSPEKAIQLSLYAAGFRAALETVGPERLVVLTYEDLVEDHRTWKKQLGDSFSCSFDNINVPNALKNPSKDAEGAKLTDSNAARLANIFRPDVHKLSELLKTDFSKRWGFS
jgi:hypothetical protein